MRKSLLLFVFLSLPYLSQGQFIKQKSIKAQIGFAMSEPYYSTSSIADSGLFLQGELVLNTYSWLDIRPYAGIIYTKSNGKDIYSNQTNEKAEMRAFLAGGKVRLRAPIPWIAPYAEIGFGASIGKFETDTNFTAIKKSGVLYHIPVSFGLELGRNHNVDIGLAYYVHPSIEQVGGAISIGLTIPIN